MLCKDGETCDCSSGKCVCVVSEPTSCTVADCEALYTCDEVSCIDPADCDTCCPAIDCNADCQCTDITGCEEILDCGSNIACSECVVGNCCTGTDCNVNQECINNECTNVGTECEDCVIDAGCIEYGIDNNRYGVFTEFSSINLFNVTFIDVADGNDARRYCHQIDRACNFGDCGQCFTSVAYMAYFGQMTVNGKDTRYAMWIPMHWDGGNNYYYQPVSEVINKFADSQGNNTTYTDDDFKCTSSSGCDLELQANTCQDNEGVDNLNLSGLFVLVPA